MSSQSPEKEEVRHERTQSHRLRLKLEINRSYRTRSVRGLEEEEEMMGMLQLVYFTETRKWREMENRRCSETYAHSGSLRSSLST